MLAYAAYFDDSGKKESEALVVGGYIASLANWARFASDWRLLLASKNIDEFKRADFNARKIGGWSNQARDRFLADLAEIIHQYTAHAFAHTVFIADWKRANEKYELAEKNLHPYPLCARTCMKSAREWCERNGHDKNQVEYIFDKGSEHAEHLPQLLTRDADPRLRALALVPADSAKVSPIQAADYFAWEVRHQHLKNTDPHPSEAYHTLRRLLRFPHAHAVTGGYDFARLEELAVKMRIPRRGRF